MTPRTFAVTMLAVGVVGCSTTAPEERRVPEARAWVLWAVEKDYITEPEILRPLEAFATRRQCEIYKSAVVKVQLERFDKLDRENQQRAMQAAVLVKRLRDERGWTQEQLAERAGVPHATISKVESGDKPYSLSVDVVFKLANALGVKIGELDKWGPHMPRNTVTQAQCWPDTIDPRGPKGDGR